MLPDQKNAVYDGFPKEAASMVYSKIRVTVKKILESSDLSTATLFLAAFQALSLELLFGEKFGSMDHNVDSSLHRILERNFDFQESVFIVGLGIGSLDRTAEGKRRHVFNIVPDR
jgi:hypothetical protein